MAIRLNKSSLTAAGNHLKSLPLAIKVLWLLAISFLVGLVLFFLYLSKDDLPSFESLENPQYDLASIVYASDGTPIGKYYIENRENVVFDSISPYVLNALFATEDVRFRKHSGIDFRALGRVFFKSILLSSDSGGGSTLTQQLAKLLFDRPSLRNMNKISRSYALLKIKLKEWITAVRIERNYTKEEIIAMYLNKFEFINGAHGIQAASQTYFGKNQSRLLQQEAAVLVGMLQNPSLYNPVRFPEKAKERRDIVLGQMYRYDFIDRDERDSLTNLDLDMTSFQRENHNDGLAPYFRAELTKWLRALLEQEELKKPDGSKFNIYTDGLRIHTTIDPIYQKHAEDAMREHMAVVQSRYWGRWKGMDPYKYGADKNQEALRRASLMRRVYDSKRYENLHNKYISKALDEINDKYDGVQISRYKLPLIINYNSEEALLEKSLIGPNDVAFYKKLLKSNDWTDLQKTYSDFYKRYEEEFLTEIPMMVFAYNEAGEEQLTMSPLDSVEYHLRHLQTGILAVEPGTGYIKAWVGGPGFKYFKYDHVSSRRQVGSTIKPFVYSAAIAFQGVNPCQTFDDIQYSIAPGESSFDLLEVWTPGNAEGNFSGNKYNLYQGLLYSKNSITVRLIKEMGTVQIVRDLLNNVGIDIENRHPNGELVVPNLPSIALGAMDLTVKEMTGAYSTFSNNGVYTEPIFITRIEDKNGKVIYRQIGEKREALNTEFNAVMVDMLQNSFSGRAAAGLKSPIGGKTGTTNDYTDGWFMGITPDLVVGTWVGGDENWVRFFSLDAGQGSVMAKPFFVKFLQKLEADTTSNYNATRQFFMPSSGIFEYTDCIRFKGKEPDLEQAALKKKKGLNNEFDEEEFDQD